MKAYDLRYIKRTADRTLSRMFDDSKPIEFKDGYLLLEMSSFEEYTKNNSKEDYATLQKIIIFKPTEKKPVSIGVNSVKVEKQTKIYEILFEPTWKKRLPRKEGEILHRLPDAFIPDKRDKDKTMGDIFVYGNNATGKYENNKISPKVIRDSNYFARGMVAHLEGNKLKEQLERNIGSVGGGCYETEFHTWAQIPKTIREYLIRINGEEAEEITKKVLEQPFFINRKHVKISEEKKGLRRLLGA